MPRPRPSPCQGQPVRRARLPPMPRAPPVTIATRPSRRIQSWTSTIMLSAETQSGLCEERSVCPASQMGPPVLLPLARARLRGRGGALAPLGGVDREADCHDQDAPVEEKLDVERGAKLLHA